MKDPTCFVQAHERKKRPQNNIYGNAMINMKLFYINDWNATFRGEEYLRKHFGIKDTLFEKHLKHQIKFKVTFIDRINNLDFDPM